MSKAVPTWDYPDETRHFVEVGLWAGRERFPAESVALGFAREGEGLVAGFIYHNWNPAAGTIEVSGYSTCRDWCGKAGLQAIFSYPFETVGVRMVVARHSEHNARVIRIWRSLGAQQYRIPALRGPDEAEIICTYSREAWLAYQKKGKANG